MSVSGKQRVRGPEIGKAISAGKTGKKRNGVVWNKGKTMDHPVWNKGKNTPEEIKRKLSENLKGKTWKLINGKRVWLTKDEL